MRSSLTLQGHLPAAIPELGAAVPALAISGTATAEPFLIEGEAASAQGVLKGGIDRIRIHDRVVVRDLTVGNSLGINFIAMPGALRRERTGPMGTVMENIVVTPTLPLVAAQWSRSPVGDDDTLRLAVTPGGARVRYDLHDGVLRAVGQDPDQSVVVALYGGTGRWTLADDGHGHVLASHEMGGDGPLTLLVTAGPDAALRSALAAAAHLPVHEQRAASTTAEGVRVLTGVAELDDGIAWASCRVRASLRRGAMTTSGHHVFWSGLGALAVADVESARRAVALLEGQLKAGQLKAGQPAWPVEAMTALLAASLALTSGDASAARHHAHLLLDRAWVPSGVSSHGASLWAFALETLVHALRYTGTDDCVAGLRTLAAELPSRADDGMRLPMVADERPNAGDFLRSVLAGGLGHPPPTRIRRLDDTLRTWSGLGEDTDGAWGRWRETLSEGLVSGPSGPASWDEVDDLLAPGAPVAGAMLAAFSHGVLGYMPDAPSGRLRLAPRLPSHVRSLTVERLRVGPTYITLRYERSKTRHRFVLEPTSARVPPMLVFEPSIPGRRLAEAHIGEARADLDSIPEGERVRVRVQLPLEGPCTLDLRTE
jgi:hypothetical protein